MGPKVTISRNVPTKTNKQGATDAASVGEFSSVHLVNGAWHLGKWGRFATHCFEHHGLEPCIAK
jgi:hypothetical protein